MIAHYRISSQRWIALFLSRTFLISSCAFLSGSAFGQPLHSETRQRSSGLVPISTETGTIKGNKDIVLVIRPKEWSDAIQSWKVYRSSYYEVVEIDSVPDPHSLQVQIRQISRGLSNAPLSSPTDQRRVHAILLCGDTHEPSDSNNSALVPKVVTPTFVLKTRVKLGSFITENLCTDALFGDLDDDGCPDVAVGRLPARSATELQSMLQRSIDYESSTDFGDWRNVIHVTAGVGGFGLLIDSAIESVAKRFLSEGIPDRYRLQMSYASTSSPYCPSPDKFRENFIGNINRGGLFWVYIGHGWIDSLDDFQFGDKKNPICSKEDVARFQIENGPPIAILLACFTGAMDAKVDCLAERLLRQPGGPIAVIGGSRVTMPYGMSQLAGAMMDHCFDASSDAPELGTVLLQAKREIWQPHPPESTQNSSKPESILAKYMTSVEQMAVAMSPPDHDLLEERREHVRLMNLLGDPLLVIRHPRTIPIQTPESIVAGNEIPIAITAPWSGTYLVELLLSRDRIPDGVQSLGTYSGTTQQNEMMQSNYETANDLVLWSQTLELNQGEFQIVIPGDKELRGKHVVRVISRNRDAWGAGTQRVQIRRPPKGSQ